jgi:hypothetical protein
LRTFTPELGPGSSVILKHDDHQAVEAEIRRIANSSPALDARTKEIIRTR